MRAAIITLSNSGYAGGREDKSGPAIRELAEGECKLSVRTSGGLNATRVCALLGGGGHAAAAGCTVKGSVADAREAILNAIRTVQRDG